MGLNRQKINLIMIFGEYKLILDGDKSGLELLLGFLVAGFLYLAESKELGLHLLEFGFEGIDFVEFIFDEERLLGELFFDEELFLLDLVKGCHFMD